MRVCAVFDVFILFISARLHTFSWLVVQNSHERSLEYNKLSREEREREGEGERERRGRGKAGREKSHAHTHPHTKPQTQAYFFRFLSS